jgi:integrase/recombinase XerD
MPLTRQAKTLSEPQVRSLLRYVEAETRHGERNRVIVLLSFLCGLRAKEIVSVRWHMVTGADGRVDGVLSLPNSASKGKNGGRAVPLPMALQKSLRTLHESAKAAGRGHADDYIIAFQQHAMEPDARSNTVRWLFKQWFTALGFKGASSHSGRRSFATKAAREIGRFGGSLRDVQQLLGHASLSTTQKYLDSDARAQAKLLNQLWKSVG